MSQRYSAATVQDEGRANDLETQTNSFLRKEIGTLLDLEVSQTSGEVCVEALRQTVSMMRSDSRRTRNAHHHLRRHQTPQIPVEVSRTSATTIRKLAGQTHDIQTLCAIGKGEGECSMGGIANLAQLPRSSSHCCAVQAHPQTCVFVVAQPQRSTHPSQVLGNAPS